MDHRILCIIIFVLAAFLLLASSTVVYASMRVKVQSPLTKYYANSTYRFLETKFTVYWRPPVPLENITSYNFTYVIPGFHINRVLRADNTTWIIVGYFTGEAPLGGVRALFNITYSYVKNGTTLISNETAYGRVNIIPRIIKGIVAYTDGKYVYVENPEGILFNERGQLTIPYLIVYVNNVKYVVRNLERKSSSIVAPYPKQGALVKVVVEDDVNGTLTFTYDLGLKTHIIVKVLRDDNNKPIEGARVTIIHNWGVSELTTNSSGIAGDYVKPGFITVHVEYGNRQSTIYLDTYNPEEYVAVKLDYTAPRVKVVKEGYPLILDVEEQSLPIIITEPEEFKYISTHPGRIELYIPYDGVADIKVSDVWGNTCILRVHLSKPVDYTIQYTIMAFIIVLVIVILVCVVAMRTPREWKV